ncbi:hypothetical protein BT96DRAFT_398138 [Gymnopus androsaceus JB14]|uniref:Uncharacterized protein n=1 Tax=Gymnopus androsaceus JB14 TaxID=1447944 RepID=A0A6A4HZP9_9AGAR|nr:hypothetical protein BT96DRAFT_398138 [Gymnopus androsaceus JB14]
MRPNPPSPTASTTESSQQPDSAPTVPNTPRSRSDGTQSSLFPPTVPNTPRESAHSRGSSQSILRGASNSSISSNSSTSSAGSISQPSTAPRAKAKKPYLNGLATPNRPAPKPRSDYGSSTFSFPTSSFSGPSVPSESVSDKGYITESSRGSRSSSKNRDSSAAEKGDGRQVTSLRSVSSSSAQSFTSTSSTTSAASGISSLSSNSSTTAPSSAECSPKKTSSILPKIPLLPTIPSGSLLKTPPGSPEMELAGFPPVFRNGREPKTPSATRTSISPGTPSGPPKTPASKVSNLSRVPPSERKQLFGGQPRTLMMLKKDVDFVPQSPQKMQGFRKMDMSGNVCASSPGPGGDVSVGTVAGMGGRRTRTHSRTRSAFALGISSTRTSSRTSSRERGHARARSVGRRDSEMASGMLEGDDVSSLVLVLQEGR